MEMEGAMNRYKRDTEKVMKKINKHKQLTEKVKPDRQTKAKVCSERKLKQHRATETPGGQTGTQRLRPSC